MPPELLDRPELGYEERRRALADLSRVNRLLLGYRSVLRTLAPALAAVGGRQRLLDVGTGSGEAAEKVVQALARRGVEVKVVGLDLSLSHLVIGRRMGRAKGGAHLRVVGSAEALPFADGAVDWAFSTLLFHHFDAATNRRVLTQMRRVARRAAVVVDLRRSPLTTLLARLLLPLLGIAHTARHDGYVSVARAATVGEVRRLLEGEAGYELRRRFPCRFSLVIPGVAEAPAAEGLAGEGEPPRAAGLAPIPCDD